jgi:hypothetical protein
LEPSDATGIVSFYIGEDHYDPEIDDGKASYTVPGLADGTYTVKTVYPVMKSTNTLTLKT